MQEVVGMYKTPLLTTSGIDQEDRVVKLMLCDNYFASFCEQYP